MLMSAQNGIDQNSLNPNIPMFYNNSMVIPPNTNGKPGFTDLSLYQNHTQHSNSNGMNNPALAMHQNMAMARQNQFPVNFNNNSNPIRYSNMNQSITSVNNNSRNNVTINPTYHNIIYNNNNNNHSMARNPQIGNIGFDLKELELKYRSANSPTEQNYYLSKIKTLDPNLCQTLVIEARNRLQMNQNRLNTNHVPQMTQNIRVPSVQNTGYSHLNTVLNSKPNK